MDIFWVYNSIIFETATEAIQIKLMAVTDDGEAAEIPQCNNGKNRCSPVNTRDTTIFLS